MSEHGNFVDQRSSSFSGFVAMSEADIKLLNLAPGTDAYFILDQSEILAISLRVYQHHMVLHIIVQ